MSEVRLLLGDVQEMLRTLPTASVDCIVTSPPYWGLRDYGTAQWEGGDPNCDHVSNPRATKTFGNPAFNENRPSREETKTAGYYANTCPKCGAVRVDNQLGLEPVHDCGAWERGKFEPYAYIDVDEDGETVAKLGYKRLDQIQLCGNCYVCKMIAVFREAWRVLKDTGTLWLVLGDSYATSPAGNTTWGNGVGSNKHYQNEKIHQKTRKDFSGLKQKDLVGIPWRVAFALQADGWWLRSDIVWHKTNPMPESVTDRPTKSHEFVFLLTKSKSYYYDAVAIKEPLAESSLPRMMRGVSKHHKNVNGAPGQTRHSMNQPRNHGDGYSAFDPTGRNKRDVWTVSTKPYKKAHFATFPPDLIEPCILAGSSAGGVCPICGAPWERVTDKEPVGDNSKIRGNNRNGTSKNKNHFLALPPGKPTKPYTTTGWRPTCKHAADPIPSVVMDIFNGAGTTGLVAQKHGRDYIGIDLNSAYLEMTRERLGLEATNV